MILRTLFSGQRLVRGLLIASLGLLVALPVPSRTEEPSAARTREEEIASLERQIADLHKKLAELRKTEAAPLTVKPEPGLPESWVKALSWRCIGPASMGGRIVAVSVYEADPSTWWIATASGGLLKTINNGVTFEHQFDREATVSIGDVAVAQSDSKIVWVGTGENNPRNSVSYGDGVYKSSDGGKSWKNMGLKKTFQIGRIAIHPKNPDIVYVGALGRLYGPSEERGVYKTTDGGKTWSKVLTLDDKTGVIDLQMDPSNPETLLAAAWERRRDGFDSHPGDAVPLEEGYDRYDPIKKWGPKSGIYRTTDGGTKWDRITKGLPTCEMGRIGIDFYRKNPKTVFAVVDSAKIGMGTAPKQTFLGIQGENVDGGGAKIMKVTADSPAAKDGLKAGDVIKATDKDNVANYPELVNRIQGKKEGDKVVFTVVRDKETLKIEVTLEARAPTNVLRPFSFWYGGQRENVQGIQGADDHDYGGVYKSTDGGETWTRLNSVNPRPMYFSQVRVDPSDEKYLYVLGITLYRSNDGGKTFKSDGGNGVHPDQHALWIDPKDGRHMIVGCDGGSYVTYDRMNHWDFLCHVAIGQFYHVCVDNSRPYRAFGGLQDNGSWGGPSHSLMGRGPINEDWLVVGGGDGFVCRVDPTDPDLAYAESQDGNIYRRNLRTGEGARIRPIQGQGQPGYRFNWNTPFILSSHNPHIFYSAGNYVFRSVKQGAELKVISPEITRTKRGSGSAIAESPRNPDLLYAGTDDGNLWLTRDGGNKWTNLTDKMLAKNVIPGPRWVATIEPSRYKEGRCYAVLDAHRSDDDEPYVFVTEDFGESWTSLRANLPTGSTRCLREDIKNEDVLYLGTEFSVYASLDRGKAWTKINNNLPTVAIHELAQHPTAGEMVAATHGRSLWVLDVSALRQMKPETPKEDAKLFEPAAAVRWRTEPNRGSVYGIGSRVFEGENPPWGAQLYYSLAKKAEKGVSLKIVDFTGQTAATLKPKNEPGLHRISWDLTRASNPLFGPRRGGWAAPGMYRVVLTVDGKEYTQSLRVEADPVLAATLLTAEPDGQPLWKPVKPPRIDDD